MNKPYHKILKMLFRKINIFIGGGLKAANILTKASSIFTKSKRLTKAGELRDVSCSGNNADGIESLILFLSSSYNSPLHRKIVNICYKYKVAYKYLQLYLFSKPFN